MLDLRDDLVDRQVMKAQLVEWPIPGLREVIVIDANGAVISFFP